MTDHLLMDASTCTFWHGDDVPAHCPICDGGLSLCTICHGGEAQLPTECPGRVMTEEECDQVVAGKIDFRDGEWKEPLPPRYMMCHGEQV